jgi:hypothetical protein
MAKQIASSTLESIFSARDITAGPSTTEDQKMAAWLKIGNVGTNPNSSGVNQGVFMTGFRPIREDYGADNFVGTADDACNAPGACGSNSSPVITGFWRQIVITDITDPERPTPPWPIMMRRIEITIRYPGTGGMREEKVSTIISKY